METVKTGKIDNKTVTGSTLKIIAIVTMLIDHTAANLLDNYFISLGLHGTMIRDQHPFLYYLYFVMRGIGRIAFPIFIFLLIEGAMHTRSKIKYALRLSLFALISEIPFDLCFRNAFFDFSYQNVFFTLAIGMYMIILFDLIEKGKLPKLLSKLFFALGIFSPAAAILYVYGESFIYQLSTRPAFLSFDKLILYLIVGAGLSIVILCYLFFVKSKHGTSAFVNSGAFLFIFSAGILASELLKTDYSALGVLTITVMYQLRARKTPSFLISCLVLTFFNFFELPALLGIIPVGKYNGERGLNIKYFFYIFYPVHLLILSGLSYLLFS